MIAVQVIRKDPKRGHVGQGLARSASRLRSGLEDVLALFWPLLALLLILASPALADRRVALVVGNSAYQFATPLANPKNDATRVADKLRALGYEVTLALDQDGQAFRVTLGTFSEAALGADLALFFYAGHGIEMSGRNFLIPVDAAMRSEATASFETVALDQVLTAVQGAKGLGIVMLDACRDNPFGATMKRSSGTRAVSRGLAPVPLDQGNALLVSFAAEPGNTADDGDADHSPYTEAFLEILDEPGMEVGRVFRNLRARVKEKTNGRQQPVFENRLPDYDVYLSPPVEGAVPAVQNAAVTPSPAPAAPVDRGVDPMGMFYEAVRSNDSAKLSEFVAMFPDHPRADDARKMMESLEDEAMWAQIAADGSEAALRRYLLIFPSGLHAAEAARRIEEIRAASAPPPAPVPTPTPSPVVPAPAVQTPGFQTRRSQPSFNCNLASTGVELAICGYEELAVQDQYLLRVYKSAVSVGRTNKTVQRNWLLQREAVCNGPNVVSCVYTVTAQRITELGG